MKNILAELVEKQNTPSVQYLIATEDHILFEFYKGFSNFEKNVSMDAAKSYNIFSVTKTFTAIAIMQLQE